MRKFYSFVLMATMLLMGTNAWADENTTLQNVQTAFGNATSITLNEVDGFGWLQFDGQLVFNQPNKHFVLDLGGLTLKMNNNGNVGILVERGTLEIKNGTITNVNPKTIDLIRVIGDYNTGWDAANENTYSRLIVDADATIENNTLLAAGTKYNALTITENATKVNDKAYANGARIDVYGQPDGYTYGIKVNGSIKRPAEDADAAYVYIHSGAVVTADYSGTGSVAAYSSGFARWRIEGTCSASTGLYVKGGQVEVANATITSEQSSQVVPTTGGKSGVNAGGSAIVIESNSNYPGDIAVAISGQSTIQGAGGYAIEETVAANVTSTEVEIVSIQGGTLSGNAGAIIVDDKSDEKVTVAGGNINGTIEVSGTTEVVQKTVEDFINGTTPEDQVPDPDYNVVKGGTEQNPTYQVTPNTAKVATMNAYGFSTFSSNVGRKIKTADAEAGLKAYTAQYNNGALVLTEIANGIIPAGNGVILWGALNQSYSFEAVDNSSVLANNDLRPASAWGDRDQANTFFVLSGNLMYKYVGNEMKDNKAYLEVAAPAHAAPARMRLVIAEPQAVENVATEADKAQKFIENGQVFIKRGERVYNVQGQIVK